MITIKDLHVRFGSFRAVDGVSLDLERGESLALWGSNGAGKSTLIRALLGLVRYRGQIKVGGLDVSREGKAARRMIGYVPQELGFYDDLRVGEAVRFFARLRGLRVSERASLERVGLGGHDRKRIRDLSGGMKQRLALTIAMLGDPPVLVLDEVTASLDAAGRNEFMQLLGGLAGHAAGTGRRTMLFASHRVEEIQVLGNRVVLLEHGRLVADQPASRFVSELLGGDVIRLRIDLEHRPRAMEVLQRAGFAPHLNGVGILVPIADAAGTGAPSARTSKSAPIHALAEAKITVTDFDLTSVRELRLGQGLTHGVKDAR